MRDMKPAFQVLLALGGTLLGGALLCGAYATAASAETGRVTWTTYLYQGPGPHYAVVDEVQQAQALTVGKCANAWCEVSYDGRYGYVREEVVARGDAAQPAPGLLPQPAAAIVPAPKGPCFHATMTGGNGGKDPSIFCDK